jgi:hypothetical protein
MQTLRRSPISTRPPAQANRGNNDRHAKSDDDLIDCYPRPRYFQVHFQHLHENNQQLHEELAQLKASVAQVDEKLGRLLALLEGTINHLR